MYTIEATQRKEWGEYIATYHHHNRALAEQMADFFARQNKPVSLNWDYTPMSDHPHSDTSFLNVVKISVSEDVEGSNHARKRWVIATCDEDVTMRDIEKSFNFNAYDFCRERNVYGKSSVDYLVKPKLSNQDVLSRWQTIALDGTSTMCIRLLSRDNVTIKKLTY